LADQTRTTLWRSALIVFAGNTLARALGFVFPVVLAHLLKRDDFALAYFFINGGFFVAELVTASYATAMIRHIAAEGEHERKGTWLVAAIVRGMPMICLAAIVGEAVSLAAGAPPLMMTAMVVGLSIDIYYFGALSGLQMFGTLVGYRIAANLVQLLLLAVLAIVGFASVPTVVTLYALVYVVPIIVIETVRVPVATVLRSAGRPTRSDFAALTRFAMPSLVAGLAYGGVLGLDVVLVRLLSRGDLATYGAARALTLPMTMIPLALGVVLLPRVAATPQGERWQLLVKAVTVTGTLTLAVGLAYAVLGGWAIRALFPASYEGATGTLHALVPALGLLGIYGVMSQWCLGAGFPKWPASSLTLGAFLATAADVVLIPRYGAVGAGIGMTIGLSAAIAVLGRLMLRRARPTDQPPRLRWAPADAGAALRATVVVVLLVLFGAAVARGYGFEAVAILVALVGAVLVIERPIVGALILVSAVPAFSGLNRGLPVPGLRLGELLVVAIFFLALISTRSAGWQRFDWIALLYVTGTLILGVTDLLLRGTSISLDDFSKLLGPLEFFLLYRVVLATATTPAARSRLLKWMFLASVPVAALALLQFVDAPGTRALASSVAGETDSLQEYHSLYRATALFAQGHLLGSFMMLVILVGLALLLDFGPLPIGRRLLIGILVLDGFSTAATATLTPVLGVVAGSFALAYWYRRLGRVALTGAVTALVIAFAFGSTVSARYDEQFGQSGANGGTPSTLAFRWDVWTQQYLPTVRTHLVTGYGPDLPPGAVWKATESLYITLLLRGGLPLLLIYAWLMWSVARSAWRIDDDRRPIARTMVVLTGILVILHTQNNYFIDSGFPQLWWALAGMILAGSKMTAAERAARAKPRQRLGLSRRTSSPGRRWPGGAIPSW
jgi:O-antigen/teichoic acid export membrane protein